MKAPQSKLGAFLYSMAVGLGIMCVIITFLVLASRYAAAASTYGDPSQPYMRGIPSNFERYPYIERLLRDMQLQQRTTKDSKCSACILREYQSTTPDDRLQRLRDTIERYNYPVQ